jgi:hypothetical protein
MTLWSGCDRGMAPSPNRETTIESDRSFSIATRDHSLHADVERKVRVLFVSLTPSSIDFASFLAHNTTPQRLRMPTLSYRGCRIALYLYISRFYLHVDMHPYEQPLQRASVGVRTLGIHRTPLLCLYLASLMSLHTIRTLLLWHCLLSAPFFYGIAYYHLPSSIALLTIRSLLLWHCSLSIPSSMAFCLCHGLSTEHTDAESSWYVVSLLPLTLFILLALPRVSLILSAFLRYPRFD